MRRDEVKGRLWHQAFRAARGALGLVSGGRISAFGPGQGKIGMVLIVNLDRQPQRLRRTLRELRRFRTSDGSSLESLARRLAAVDARDGRAIAATGDIDQNYRLGDQLYVQPDARLEACFAPDEPVRMTRQEVAVAQSHVEAWKVIAAGPSDHVLVLEDDVWFRTGAAAAIDRGWCAALHRQAGQGGPHLLYLSYDDAGGTASRTDLCDALFRPERGLWFLSGYVLSRAGAERLLRAMPIVGPVDMWINYRFEELAALALASPAILQRPDSGSDNAYSVLPFLARAGIVDADKIPEPQKAACTVFAWTAGSDTESLPMALSMLGLRVRAFDQEEPIISAGELAIMLTTFDALVDPPLTQQDLISAISKLGAKLIFEANAYRAPAPQLVPAASATFLPPGEPQDALWRPICDLLNLARPTHPFPKGAPRAWRLFRDDREAMPREMAFDARWGAASDDSPWALLPGAERPTLPRPRQTDQVREERLLYAALTSPCSHFGGRTETFPGNLAAFAREGLSYGGDGAQVVIDKIPTGDRPYRSGAFASARAFAHGRVEAEIRAARGSGLVTGFFLHRAAPRQEIDIELTGDNPRSMLVNVYFNPGDDGAELGFGYRGSPCRIDLGFDACSDFHRYAIEWRHDCVTWLVDDIIVHERAGWSPTPIPHLPMKLHANLWAPRSKELAGLLDDSALPSSAMFRNISIWAY